MEGNYLSIASLGLAAGSYAYTYSQISAIQKEITKVGDSIKGTNDSIKTYDENVKLLMEKNEKEVESLKVWSDDVKKSFDQLSSVITGIEQFLIDELGYRPQQ